jgi:hypothetical protein
LFFYINSLQHAVVGTSEAHVRNYRKMEKNSQGLVAQACNPSYSGGRDQKITVPSQARQIVHKTLSRKNPLQKGASGMAQGEGPEIKPQYHKKKKGKWRKIK